MLEGQTQVPGGPGFGVAVRREAARDGRMSLCDCILFSRLQKTLTLSTGSQTALR